MNKISTWIKTSVSENLTKFLSRECLRVFVRPTLLWPWPERPTADGSSNATPMAIAIARRDVDEHEPRSHRLSARLSIIQSHHIARLFVGCASPSVNVPVECLASWRLFHVVGSGLSLRSTCQFSSARWLTTNCLRPLKAFRRSLFAVIPVGCCLACLFYAIGLSFHPLWSLDREFVICLWCSGGNCVIGGSSQRSTMRREEGV